PAVLSTIRDKKSIDDDLKAAMREAVEDFKSTRWGGKNEQNANVAVAENTVTANA
ncbi:MAG: hypothetical protein H0U50_06590, partial [Pyrinomonadaceae bacterium]|nr:hypothetical protein [Pyrinomonadaceae bacterium]